MDTAVHDLEFTKAALIQILEAAPIEVDLISPRDPKGVVLLVHGSGSSRLSPRNRFVASLLRERGMATALLDAETAEERSERAVSGIGVVDLPEMATRILKATDWLLNDEHVSHLPIGYYGSGTGAAAAFMAASERSEVIRGIVARGGRLELTDGYLERVTAPTLLIVGARDVGVAHHNRDALDRLASPVKRLEVIPGAQHSFEEPGALTAAAMHASCWFASHLPARTARQAVAAVAYVGR